MSHYIKAIIIIIMLTPISHAQNKPPSFSLPIDCKIYKNCWIVNYIDHDPSPNIKDHTCGSLSYDGNEGIDFALKNQLEMLKGVNVIAASSGIVKAMRDGEVERLYSEKIAKEISGRECGNGAIIDHGNGWETQYCHLQRGSLVVQVGDRIKKGEKIGKVGLSGRTQFPHIDFTIRKNGSVYDPFTGLGKNTACNETKQSLWDPKIEKQLIYKPTSVINVGFSAKAPKWDDVKLGKHNDKSLPNTIEALVFWSEILGVEAGDTITLTIKDNSNKVLTTDTTTIPKNKIIQFLFAGKKREASLWAKGLYTGTIEIIKKSDGSIITQTGQIKIQ